MLKASLPRQQSKMDTKLKQLAPLYEPKQYSTSSQPLTMKIKFKLVPLLIALSISPLSFAQDMDDDSDQMIDMNSNNLDELLRKIESEDDGDDDLPTAKPKPKAHSKFLSTYGAKQSLRFKLNKDAFIDGYLDEGIGAQDNPYKKPTSKFTGGVAGNFLFKGYTFSGVLDLKRNYIGTFNDWDEVLDKTYSLAVARKIKLNNQWTVAPSIRQTVIDSDQKTRNLRKTDLTLPFSYALDKVWTIKALTVGYSTQTFTNRAEAQTDRTWTVSSGFAYKWSDKTTLDLTVSREERYSNKSSVEYSKTTVMPKLEYKLSPTSSVGFGLGYVTHSNSTEQFSRWLLAPKVQLRWDM